MPSIGEQDLHARHSLPYKHEFAGDMVDATAEQRTLMVDTTGKVKGDRQSGADEGHDDARNRHEQHPRVHHDLCRCEGTGDHEHTIERRIQDDAPNFDRHPHRAHWRDYG